MDSNLNYRHSQVRSAEFHRQAELHRLARAARADRETRPRRRATFRVPNPAAGVARVIAFVTSASRSS
jgi:hypothetical protein